jgi:hypothetical protein
MNRDKEIYTWDDVDKKEAYFYEKLTEKFQPQSTVSKANPKN